MYQGKFSNKSGRRNHSREYELQQKRMEALEENRRQEGRPPRPAERPQRPQQAEPVRQPVERPQRPQQAEPVRQPVERPQRPQQGELPRQPVKPQQAKEAEPLWPEFSVKNRQTEKTAKDPDLSFNLNFEAPGQSFMSEENEDPAANAPAPMKGKQKKSKGALVGGIVFYLVFFIAIAAFLLGLQLHLRDLSAELSDFEKKQPEYVASAVFQDIFGNPSWGAVYDNAKLSLSPFEGKDAYAAYMTERTESEKLTYRAVPTDDTDRNQYDVFLGDEKAASFFLVNDSMYPDSPQWKFDSIRAYAEGDRAFRISAPSESVVKVNGVELDETFLIQKSGIKAAADLKELSDGKLSAGVSMYEVDGLLVPPTVTVESKGAELQVSFDEENEMFSAAGAEEAIPEEAKNLAVSAVETYCKFMIKKASSTTLSKYFKPNTPSYRAITQSDLTWIQKEKSHSIADPVVSDYNRLSDTAFTIHVHLTWQLIRKDDTVKESPVDVSLLFEQETSGKWRCTRMTGLDLTETYQEVRVRFLQHGEQLAASMVDSSSKTIQCPVPEAPEGKTFTGWVTILTNEQGEEYYQRVLIPDESGLAAVPEGYLNESVDFFPVFAKQ